MQCSKCTANGKGFISLSGDALTLTCVVIYSSRIQGYFPRDKILTGS